jgi:hypothetical protein
MISCTDCLVEVFNATTGTTKSAKQDRPPAITINPWPSSKGAATAASTARWKIVHPETQTSLELHSGAQKTCKTLATSDGYNHAAMKEQQQQHPAASRSIDEQKTICPE